jgi:polyphosphate kinase 2 (PPK2 family)
VHPEFLERQRIPRLPSGKHLWAQRFQEINRFERYLTDNGVVVVKFFLHMSKEEQRRRFLGRLERPEKFWKFEPGDLVERTHWREYQDAYEDMLRHTSTDWAPWYVVPADHKWFTRLVVADVLCDVMDGMSLQFPSLTRTERQDREKIRRSLLRKGRDA